MSEFDGRISASKTSSWRRKKFARKASMSTRDEGMTQTDSNAVVGNKTTAREKVDILS